MREKLSLWMESGKGFKSRFDTDLQPAPAKRDDLSSPRVLEKITRGDSLQGARLQYYPSIDVDRDDLFAGYMEGDLDDARDRLYSIGYRNNPTAYVEVTEENGPDDGSFARQYITETQASPRRNFIHNYPTIFRRVKNQIHVCVWQLDDRVEFLAHDEKSAWLQPARHVAVSEGEGEIGVREFRNDWYDEFGERLNGIDEVKWDVVR